MAYCSCTRVAGLIPNLLNGASDIEGMPSTIKPASEAIVEWMSTGCAIINARLQSMGYAGGGVGTTHPLYEVFADINANYAAYRAELSRSSPRTSPGERTRADMFKRAYLDGLKMLEDIDLTMLGDTRVRDSGWYVGGVSESEKESVASNTDRVVPRFARGKFKNPDYVGASEETVNDEQAR